MCVSCVCVSISIHSVAHKWKSLIKTNTRKVQINWRKKRETHIDCNYKSLRLPFFSVSKLVDRHSRVACFRWLFIVFKCVDFIINYFSLPSLAFIVVRIVLFVRFFLSLARLRDPQQKRIVTAVNIKISVIETEIVRECLCAFTVCVVRRSCSNLCASVVEPQ